jgi:hypothetical protein
MPARFRRRLRGASVDQQALHGWSCRGAVAT